MAGTNLALPFLIVNMGGEMIYILNQRLLAQKIPTDKSEKVRADVVRHMFSANFIKELMVPQALYSMTSTRQVFDKIAQSSIMKLQTSSMNKLFDLMLMGVKMQILTLDYPEQLLRLTLNHLDELTRLVSSKEALSLLASTSELLLRTYSNLSAAVFNRIRQTLLRFFQNRNVKVTMFLHSGLQFADGTIKIQVHQGLPMSEIPGKVSKSASESFKVLPITSTFKLSGLSSRHPLQVQTTIGCNLYNNDRQIEVTPVEEAKIENITHAPDKTRGDIAMWELNSLANMIYSPMGNEEITTINLFSEVDLEFKENTVVEVTGTLKNTHLDKIQQSLEEKIEDTKKTEDDELMDLL